MTDELRRMVARIMGDSVDTDTSKTAGEPATGTECVDEPGALGAEAKRTSPSDREQPMGLPSDHTGSAVPVEPTLTTSAALQHEILQDQGSQSQPRRGHGRALPR
jgi:hypothetical protein